MAGYLYEGTDIKAQMQRQASAFDEIIKSYGSISIVTHINPDGDTIGTALALSDILRAGGYRVEVCCADKNLPRSLDFLVGFSRIKERPDYKNSLVISCDCATVSRCGFDLDGRAVVNIDHHADNERYGTLNIIDPEAASCAEVAYELLKGRYDIGPEAARAFYTALYSDSRGFSTASVNQATLRRASELAALGAEPGYAARMFAGRRSLASIRISAAAFGGLKLLMEGRFALMVLGTDDMARAGADYEDLEGIVEAGRDLVTVEVSALIVRMGAEIKVSLRSKGPDVSIVARHFGGGGHPLAAGCKIEGCDEKEAARMLTGRVKELFEETERK